MRENFLGHRPKEACQQKYPFQNHTFPIKIKGFSTYHHDYIKNQALKKIAMKVNKEEQLNINLVKKEYFYLKKIDFFSNPLIECIPFIE